LENRGIYFYSNKLFSGTLAVSIAQGTRQAVSFLLLPILTIYLSPEDYGIIAMVGLISALLNLIYNPGIVSATTRLYYDTNDDLRKKQLFGSAFMFFVLFPGLVSVTLIFVGPYLFPLIFSSFKFYPYGVFAIILAFFSQPRRIWSQLLTVHYKVPQIALFSIIGVLLNVGISLLLVVLFEKGVFGRLVGMIMAPTMILIVSVFTFRKYTGFSFSFKTMMELFGFGSPLIVAIWCYTVLTMTSRYLLEKMIGLEAVGIFDVAFKISSVPAILFMGFKQMWSPIFYENMKDEKFYVIKRLITFFLLGMVVLCSALIFFHKEALFLIDERFRVAGEYIPAITIGLFFLGLLPISNAFLGWEKRFKTTSVIAAVAAIVNISMNLILIPRQGIYGAAISTATSYFVYFVSGLLISRKFFKQVLDVRSILIVLLLFALIIVLEPFCESQEFNFQILLVKLMIFSLVIFLVFVFKIIKIHELLEFIKKLRNRISG